MYLLKVLLFNLYYLLPFIIQASDDIDKKDPKNKIHNHECKNVFLCVVLLLLLYYNDFIDFRTFKIISVGIDKT